MEALNKLASKVGLGAATPKQTEDAQQQQLAEGAFDATGVYDHAPAALRSGAWRALVQGEPDWQGVREFEAPASTQPLPWADVASALRGAARLAARASSSKDQAFGSAGGTLAPPLDAARRALAAAAARVDALKEVIENHAQAARKPEKDAADDAAAALLANLARDCEALSPGQSLIAPVGWSDGDRRGHLMLAVVARGGVPGGWAGDDANACAVAVINGGGDGDGLLFHASRLDTTTGAFFRRSALTLQKVPRHRVAHAACWFVLLRPLLLNETEGLRCGTVSTTVVAEKGACLDKARHFYGECLPVLDDDDSARDSSALDLYVDVAATKGGAGLLAAHALVYAARGACAYLAKGPDDPTAVACALALRGAGLDVLADQLDEIKRRQCRLGDADAATCRACVERVCRAASAVESRDASTKAVLSYAKRAAQRILDALASATAREVAQGQLRADDLHRSTTARDFGAPGTLFAPFATHLHRLLPSMKGEAATIDEERRAHLDFLAGDADADALVLPSDLARVIWPLEPTWAGPYPRDSLAAACTALRRCDRACVTLEHMRDRVPRADARRFALVSHLFLRCLPCPQIDGGFWRSECTRSLQADLLFLLRRKALHASAAAASCAQTRALDGERVLCVAAVAAVADAVVRNIAVDAPCILSLFYGGSSSCIVGEGRVVPPESKPFGFAVRDFAADTGRALLPDPALVAARTSLLDYFRALRKATPHRNRVFGWERSSQGKAGLVSSFMGGDTTSRGPALCTGDARLLDRLCTALGYKREPRGASLAGYLVQDSPLLRDVPELEYLRDIVLVLKVALAPTSNVERKRWSVDDATPRWCLEERARGGDERGRQKKHERAHGSRLADAVGAPLSVTMYGCRVDVVGGDAQDVDSDDDQADTGALATALAKVRAAIEGASIPRAPPSGGDPSHLAGDVITTEDDVLHLKSLPGDLGSAPRESPRIKNAPANRKAKLKALEVRVAALAGGTGALPPRDVERLLCVLTAPYLRLPLVLRFFADVRRSRSLRDARLRSCVEACLFEPGPWLPDRPCRRVETIPAAHRDHLRTPCGALFNELALAPIPCVDAIHELLARVLEGDVGAWAPRGAAEAFLFAARTAARAVTFLRAVAGGSATPKTNSAPGAGTPRGLDEADAPRKAVCMSASKALTATLTDKVAPALKAWLPALTKDGSRTALRRACAVHAHIAYSAAKCVTSDTLDRTTATALLEAQCFLAAYDDDDESHSLIDADIDAHDPQAKAILAEGTLGLADSELCAVWQRHRGPLLTFLRDDPGSAECLEAAVDAVAAAAESSMDKPERNGVARRWREDDACPGRFSPIGENDQTRPPSPRAKKEQEDDDDDYEAWLRGVLEPKNAEIVDAQLGEFTLKTRRLEALPRDVADHADLQRALDNTSGGDDLRAAEVSHRAFRRHWRLVSRRVDVVKWTKPPQEATPLAPDPPFGINALRPLEGSGSWVTQLLDRLRTNGPLSSAKLFALSGGGLRDARCVCVGYVEVDHTKYWREVHCRRSEKLVEVYELVEHGRQWWRALIYTSDASLSLGVPLPPAPGAVRADAFEDNGDTLTTAPLERGQSNCSTERGPSLEISRTAKRCSERVRQTYVPASLLRGLLPDALLETFVFWRNHDDASLSGYEERQTGSDRVETLRVRLTGRSQSPRCDVVRLVLRRGSSELDDDIVLPDNLEGFGIDLSIKPLALLRMGGCGAEPSPLASKLRKLDALSHALAWVEVGEVKESSVWAGKQDDPEAAVSRIELPRLRITLRRRHGRYFCDEYDGYALVDSKALTGEDDDLDREGDALNLVAPLGACVVLRDPDTFELKVLMSAGSRPFRSPDGRKVVFDHDDSRWRRHDAGHHLYSVDRLAGQLVPENACAAVAQVLRLCLARRYDAASLIAPACASDEARPPLVDAMISALSACQGDVSPDARACRLKLSLAALDCGCDAFIAVDDWPWAFAEEAALVVHHRSRINASCALSIADEARALAEVERRRAPLGFRDDAADAPLRRAVANRSLCVNTKQKPTLQDYAIAPSLVMQEARVGVEISWAACRWPDERCRRAKPTSWTTAYARPCGFKVPATDSQTGLPVQGPPRSVSVLGGRAIAWLRKATAFSGQGADSLEACKGDAQRDGCFGATPFGVCYELLTNTLPLRVGDRDGAFGWGVALLHLYERAFDVTNGRGGLDDGGVLCYSTLAILARRAALAQSLSRSGKAPRYVPPEKPSGYMESIISSGDATQPLKKAWVGLATALRAAHKAGELLPDANRPPLSSTRPPCVVASAVPTMPYPAVPSDAVPFSPKNASHALGDGSFDVALVEDSVGHGAPSGLVVTSVRTKNVSTKPPYDLSTTAVAGEPTAAAYVQRLHHAAQEDGALEREREVPSLLGFDVHEDRAKAASTAKALADFLSHSVSKDTQRARAARRRLGSLLDGGTDDDRRWHASTGQAKPRRTLGDVLRALAEGKPERPDVASLACGVALLEGRCAASRRGCRAARLLEKRVQTKDDWRELVLEAEALAATLCETRKHFRNADGSLLKVRPLAQPPPSDGSYVYDARLLLLERAWDIILREAQVHTSRTLCTDASNRKSSLRQMIMGSGKTTVLTPALVASLADGQTLVVVVVPHALVVFTRQVLAKALSRPSLGRRPVRRLRFGRRTFMGISLLKKLRAVARDGGVLLSDPTAMKALYLKSIEVLHHLDEASRYSQDSHRTSKERTLAQRKQSTFSTFFKSSKSKAADKARAAALGLDAKPEAQSSELERKIAGAAERTEREAELRSLRAQAQVAAEVLRMLRTQSVAIVDEVDVILDPLKSELNWPLGARAPLDFTAATNPPGLRWRVPYLLLDAVIGAALGRTLVPQISIAESDDSDEEGEGEDATLESDDDCLEADGDEVREAAREGVSVDDSFFAGDDEGVATRRQLAQARQEIDDIVQGGLAKGHLQARPHPTLVSEKWYVMELRPVLARWVLLLLRSPTRAAAALAGAAYAGNLGELDDSLVLAYLTGEGEDRKRAALAVDACCSDDQAKLLNLYHSWLTHMLPFSLGRVDRVAYGLLSPADLERAARRHADAEGSMVTAKHLEAVPLARRLLAVPFVGKDRPSDASEFSHPDVLIGLTTLAIFHEGLRYGDVLWLLHDLQRDFRRETGPIKKRKSFKRYARYVQLAGGRIRGLKTAKSRLVDTEDVRPEVWPVHFLDLEDDSQVRPVYLLLRRLKTVGRDYLWRRSFPETLALRPSKLAASGQELGGEAIFDVRIGFSGTPNDLVPAELGVCVYEKATDGRINRVLADSEVVSKYLVPPGWTPKKLLEVIATSDEFLALIDCGALVTGLSNREVAECLLTCAPDALSHVQGVLFYDEEDNACICTRADGGGTRVQSALTANLKPHQRFTFYDHAHCTGLDVKQRVDCVAALTVSKDTTLRDAAQAAFRLRRLGAGQRCRLFLIPQIANCVSEATLTNIDVVRKDLAMDAKWASSGLTRVLSWLAVNQIRRERVNFFVLAEQNVQNVCRKVAHITLVERSTEVGVTGEGEARLRGCLDVFRTRVDFTVENAVPTPEPTSERIAQTIEDHADLMQAASDFGTAQRMLQQVAAAESASRAKNQQAWAFEAVQEEEAEEEEEQEQEQEQEQERRQEEEVIVDELVKRDKPEAQRYVRDDEAPVPWSLETLKQPLSSKHPFYALSEFGVYRRSYLQSKPPKVHFTPDLRVSPNYFKPAWRASAPRRLKNVTVVLEWDPNDQGTVIDEAAADLALANGQSVRSLSAAARASLRRAFDYVSEATTFADEGNARRLKQNREAREAENAFAADTGGTQVLAFSASTSDLEKLDRVDAERSSHLLACANVRDTSSKDASTPDTFADAFQRLALRRADQGGGASYVVLSLAEAEHVRGALHASFRGNAKVPARAALRIVGSWDGSTPADGATRLDDPLAPGVGLVLDATKMRPRPDLERDATALAQLQFFDNADDVSPKHGALLLRALQATPPHERVRFRDDIRKSRRRPQVALFGAAGWLGAAFGKRPTAAEGTVDEDERVDPVNAPMRHSVAALVVDEEAAVVEYRAAHRSVRLALQRRGIPAAALLRRCARASKAMRVQQTYDPGRLAPVAAVASAVHWLGLGAFGVGTNVDFRQKKALDDARDELCDNLANAMDLNGDGWVALDELRAGLRDAAPRLASQSPFLSLPRLRPAVQSPAPRMDRNALLKAVDALNPWRKPDPKEAEARAKAARRKLHEKALDSDGTAKSAENLHSEARRATDDNDVLDDETLAYAKRLASEDLKGLHIKLRPPSKLEPVWSSLGTASGKPVSLWRLSGNRSTSSKLRLSLGDYVSVGVADPLLHAPTFDENALELAWDGQADHAGVLCLELSDQYTFRRNRTRWLKACAERLFPPPIRYRQVWHLPQGDRSVYGWAPVPPDANYVALGHVATRTDAPPPPRAVRCVPISMVDALAALQILGSTPAWTNSSLGGRKGSLWRHAHGGLLVVARGHAIDGGQPLHRLRRPSMLAFDYRACLRLKPAPAKPAAPPPPPPKVVAPPPSVAAAAFDPLRKTPPKPPPPLMPSSKPRMPPRRKTPPPPMPASKPRTPPRPKTPPRPAPFGHFSPPKAPQDLLADPFAGGLLASSPAPAPLLDPIFSGMTAAPALAPRDPFAAPPAPAPPAPRDPFAAPPAPRDPFAAPPAPDPFAPPPKKGADLLGDLLAPTEAKADPFADPFASPPDKPSGDGTFKIDVMAAAFGSCKCGWPKGDHLGSELLCPPVQDDPFRGL